MDKKLYELMNWPRIEALVYSEEDEPQEILGPHKVKGRHPDSGLSADSSPDGSNLKRYRQGSGDGKNGRGRLLRGAGSGQKDSGVSFPGYL